MVSANISCILLIQLWLCLLPSYMTLGIPDGIGDVLTVLGSAGEARSGVIPSSDNEIWGNDVNMDRFKHDIEESNLNMDNLKYDTERPVKIADKLCPIIMKFMRMRLNRKQHYVNRGYSNFGAHIKPHDKFHNSNKHVRTMFGRSRRMGPEFFSDNGYGSRIDAAKKLASNVMTGRTLFGMFGPGRRKRTLEVVDDQYFRARDLNKPLKRAGYLITDHGYGSRMTAGSDVAANSVGRNIFGRYGPGRR